MEYEQFEQSENTVEVAEPQLETQETSENISEVADPKPVQDAETNAFYAEQRRKQELDQFRTQAETYQQQLDRTARLAGYQSHEELVAALDQIEQEQKRQEFEQAGIDPDMFNKFLEQHPDIQYARELKAKEEEQAKFSEEANELFSEFPDLKPEQISQDVWNLKEQKGLSLLDAYLRVSYKSLGQQKEQEAIQKLQQNALSSPGSLAAGAEHKANIANMGKNDFASLVERVKRGENVQL